MTPAGIEPETFRFVAQHLNHCATAVPQFRDIIIEILKFRGMDCMVKSKANPLQVWSGPEGSRKLRFPDFMTTAQGGGRLSALRTNTAAIRNEYQDHFLWVKTHRKCSWYSFLIEAVLTPGP